MKQTALATALVLGLGTCSAAYALPLVSFLTVTPTNTASTTFTYGGGLLGELATVDLTTGVNNPDMDGDLKSNFVFGSDGVPVGPTMPVAFLDGKASFTLNGVFTDGAATVNGNVITQNITGGQFFLYGDTDGSGYDGANPNGVPGADGLLLSGQLLNGTIRGTIGASGGLGVLWEAAGSVVYTGGSQFVNFMQPAGWTTGAGAIGFSAISPEAGVSLIGGKPYLNAFNGSGSVLTFSVEKASTTVPEPTSLALLGLGLVGMVGVGASKRKANALAA